MSKFLVYGSPLSPPTRAVFWTFKALGIPFDVRRIKAGDQFTQEFRTLNPNCKFPVIVENDEFVLDESHAILRYLCKLKDSPLYPSNDLKVAAKIDKWLDWKHTFLRPGACGVTRRRVMSKMITDESKHSMFTDFKEITPEREVRILTESLDILENTFSTSNQKFLVSGKPTIADIALVTELDQFRLLTVMNDNEFDLSHKWPKVDKWVRSVITSVDGYKSTHEQFINIVSSLPSKL